MFKIFSKIQIFDKNKIAELSGIKTTKQKLVFLGNILKNDLTLYDYGINVNDAIQMIVCSENEAMPVIGDEPPSTKRPKIDPEQIVKNYKKTKSYKVGDIVDAFERILGAWFEAEILKITKKDETKLKNGNKSDDNDASNSDDDNNDQKYLFHIKYLE